MLLMRVALPNRPGSLGAVATALGSIGAQINLVEIVEKRHDVEIDEFILELPTSQSVGSIVETCDALAGVQVDWIRNYARGGNIELDIQLRQRMAADPQHAAETFVTAAPVVFRAQWALLLDVTIPSVSLSTPSAPRLDARSLMRFRPYDKVHRVVLEDGWLPGWRTCSAVVAPIATRRVVVVGRRSDPPFLASEVVRLEYLVGSVSDAGDFDHAALVTGRSSAAHRHPLADPLYRRSEPEMNRPGR